jgi:hypothetical protein
MELFWQEHKLGLQLIISTDNGDEIVGRIRSRPSGYDANARAYGYNPERAATGLPSLDEAKSFVESFCPWEELTGPLGLSVEETVRKLAVEQPPQAQTADTNTDATEIPEVDHETTLTPSTNPRQSWKFWKTD